GDYAGWDNNGVELRNGSSVTTTTGDITVVGQAGGNSTNINQWGVLVYSNGVIASSGGDISVTGLGGSTSAHPQAGILIEDNSTIRNSGAGAITINATAPSVSNDVNTAALRLRNNGRIESNGSGAISISTTRNNATASLETDLTSAAIGKGTLSGTYTGTL